MSGASEAVMRRLTPEVGECSATLTAKRNREEARHLGFAVQMSMTRGSSWVGWSVLATCEPSSGSMRRVISARGAVRDSSFNS